MVCLKTNKNQTRYGRPPYREVLPMTGGKEQKQDRSIELEHYGQHNWSHFSQFSGPIIYVISHFLSVTDHINNRS
ncbi:unnamed protein product [Haemonchus placei]|uniref:Ovule protein n=1 Tax=Haemonchus placei TaxID=6290 RepID=A0A0N4X0U8_HAEPC|nr:unnamed protein product [Haemonchus placei]